MLPKVLHDCLDHAEGSYMLPFIWYTGESKALVAREIRAVYESGAKEFVFENRGGDWFATDFWWDIFRFVLETAKSYGMRVWTLDDSHVNTGSANDSLRKEENARFRAKNLRFDAVDVAGPLVSGAVSLPRRTAGDKIIRIFAYHLDQDGVIYGKPLDLSDRVRDGICFADLPGGLWRICFLMLADPARNGVFQNYITMVSKESCRHLIDEVHEKVYAHCAEYFGNTFAGFFSDEPAFGNCDGQYGPYAYELRPGQWDKMFPWWDDFPERLAAKYGTSAEDIMEKLPALWDNMKNVSAKLRLAYMDMVTELWQENFSGQIGKWCEDHQVEYIGHNLEDSGAHMRTGWGCGHFFRSMSGQHMSGMDIVFEQLLPGINTFDHAMNSASRKRESAFYHYALPKLAASLAHITPAMKNRALSEVFGATGWSNGLSSMLGMLNSCLICGINHFIPHAFSMSLPDVFGQQEEREALADSFTPPDYCLKYLPPSFYNGSFNPQFAGFSEIIRYAQRVSHLTMYGTHQADVAVYYNAEIDWMNCGDYQLIDDTAMILTRSGYDFDFLPMDTLLNDTAVSDGKLQVFKENFSALIVPECEYIPEKLLNKFREFAAAGVPVIFTGKLPEFTENGSAQCDGLQNVALKKLPALLRSTVKAHFPEAQNYPDLRFYMMEYPGKERAVLLYNSGLQDMEFIWNGDCTIFDPWQNRIFKNNGSGKIFLQRQQLLAIFPGEAPENTPELPDFSAAVWTSAGLKYDIYMRDAGSEEFRLLRKNSEAVNLLEAENLTRCCAEFRYETSLEYSGAENAAFLEIPQAGDGATLTVNGENCGFAIGPVCRFEIAGKLKNGSNTIVISTFDNPAYVDRKGDDNIGYGSWLPLMPHGFTGDIRIGSLEK